MTWCETAGVKAHKQRPENAWCLDCELPERVTSRCVCVWGACGWQCVDVHIHQQMCTCGCSTYACLVNLPADYAHWQHLRDAHTHTTSSLAKLQEMTMRCAS
jgi:hypothetical protein